MKFFALFLLVISLSTPAFSATDTETDAKYCTSCTVWQFDSIEKVPTDYLFIEIEREAVVRMLHDFAAKEGNNSKIKSSGSTSTSYKYTTNIASCSAGVSHYSIDAVFIGSECKLLLNKKDFKAFLEKKNVTPDTVGENGFFELAFFDMYQRPVHVERFWNSEKTNELISRDYLYAVTHDDLYDFLEEQNKKFPNQAL